jgi:putative sigma-54 modulation protein
VQVEITCRHGSVSDSVQGYISQKSEKLLTFFERVTAITVTVDFAQKDRIQVEMLVDTEHRHDFVASDMGDLNEDAKTVFDLVLHKMEHQIRKYKEKLQDHRRDRPANEIADAAEAEAE